MFLDLLSQELGDSKSAGLRTRFHCPFCGETKHRFYVHNEKGLWICFRCEEKGNPVTFVMEYFSTTFEEAIDLLLQYDHDVKSGQTSDWTEKEYGSDLTEEERLLLYISSEGVAPEKVKKKLTFPSPPTNCRSLAANFNNPEAFPFFAYLHGRGVTYDDIIRHHISYVLEGEVELVDGRKLTLINHVVFFTFDANKKPVYWNTRSIEDNPFIKSFNAPSREGEYSKSTTIFNLNNVRDADRIVIHEGVFNSFMTPGCGVATFGKMVTDEQVELLLEATKEKRQPLYIYLDTDAWENMIRLANRIRHQDLHREIYYVYSGTDEDANDLGIDAVAQLIEEAIPANSEGEMILRLKNM